MADKKIKNQKLKVKSSIQKSKVAKKEAKTTGLTLPVYSLKGEKKGTVSLPIEIFGAKINNPLMAQAVRVYLANQAQGNASTKTRGEINLTKAKAYRQKGTGRARHGARSAHIFVGGGVAFGPRTRDLSLKISKKMKRLALFSALSKRLTEEKIYVVDDSALTGKTKEVNGLFSVLKVSGNSKKTSKVLFVADNETARRAASNIDGVSALASHVINTYGVLNSNFVIFSKDSVEKLGKNFKQEN